MHLKWKCASGSTLKVLALLSMTADHLIKTVWAENAFMNEHLFLLMGKWITPGFFLRTFGRLAFPIFAFLLIEGFHHTRSRNRYALNLLILAVISEIPFNLCWQGSILYPGKQNIFFTLLLGLLGLCTMEKFSEDKKTGTVYLAGLTALSLFLGADYGPIGFLFIMLLYLIKENYIIQALTAGILLGNYGSASLASIPISMYNGKRGFIRNKFLKYAFYLYYPLHLLIIHFIN